MIEITKELNGDHLVLTVKAPPLPDKKVSILSESLYDGITTIDEQVAIATADAERRLAVYAAVQGML